METNQEQINAEPIHLTEAIESLRGELRSAVEAAALEEKDIIFHPEQVELEFQVEVSRTTIKGGGLDWIVRAGVDREEARSNSHTIKIILAPTDSEGRRLKTKRSKAPKG